MPVLNAPDMDFVVLVKTDAAPRKPFDNLRIEPVL